MSYKIILAPPTHSRENLKPEKSNKNPKGSNLFPGLFACRGLAALPNPTFGLSISHPNPIQTQRNWEGFTNTHPPKKK
jgi:hypothetical protein